MRKKLLRLGVLVVGFSAYSVLAYAGTNSCGGQTNTRGNDPFNCCDNNLNGKMTDSIDGDCTWWAWKASADYWGAAPPVNGSPKDWGKEAVIAPKGHIAAFGVNSTPETNSIAYGPNHVAWVTSVSSDKKTVYVSEMNCGNPNGETAKSAAKDHFKVPTWASGKNTGVKHKASEFTGYIYRKYPVTYPYK